jgi:hypothetical protein
MVEVWYVLMKGEMRSPRPMRIPADAFSSGTEARCKIMFVHYQQPMIYLTLKMKQSIDEDARSLENGYNNKNMYYH